MHTIRLPRDYTYEYSIEAHNLDNKVEVNAIPKCTLLVSLTTLLNEHTNISIDFAFRLFFGLIFIIEIDHRIFKRNEFQYFQSLNHFPFFSGQ